MKTTTVFSLLFFCLCLSMTAGAQNYKSAVGGRLGHPFAVSFKFFPSEKGAFEFFAGTYGYNYKDYYGLLDDYGWRWYEIGGAFQKHNPLNLNVSGLETLQWYYGVGASAYFWHFDEYYGNRYSSTSFGIQGHIGLDYTFENIPLNLTLDWVPTFLVNGYGNGLGAGYGALGVRYVLSR